MNQKYAAKLDFKNSLYFNDEIKRKHIYCIKPSHPSWPDMVHKIIQGEGFRRTSVE